MQTIQRGRGRSAVAAAAYRSGQALTDDRLAMDFDFSNKDGIEHAEIMAPEDAPQAYRDRAALWNAVEAAERRKDAVPAQEVLLALPHELDFEQRRDLVRAFVQEHLVAKGMIADVAMHRPGKEGDQRNFHAHIMVTTRRVDRGGFGGKNRDWNHASFIPQLRASWSEIQNQHLRHHLGPDAPQVSHLSLAARGVDRAPTVHLGPAATALERKDVASERGELNRDVQARNDKARDLRRDYQATADRIAKTAPEIEVAVPKLLVEAEQVSRQDGRPEDGMGGRARGAFRAENPERRPGRTRANGGGRDRKGAGEGSPSADRGAGEEDPFTAPGTGRLGPQSGADDLGETRRAERHRPRPQGPIAGPRLACKSARIGSVRPMVRRSSQRVGSRTWKPPPTWFVSGARWSGRSSGWTTGSGWPAARSATCGWRTNLASGSFVSPTSHPTRPASFGTSAARAREALQRFPTPVQEQALERLRRGQGRSIGRAIIPGR